MRKPGEIEFDNQPLPEAARNPDRAGTPIRGMMHEGADLDLPPAVTGELVKHQARELAPLPPAAMGAVALTEEDLGQFEVAVGVMKKAKLIALQVTGPKDWQDIGGNPYLNASGCAKVARVFGVSFVDPKMEVRRLEDAQGHPVEQYICAVTASFRGGAVTVEGIAATNDDFFSHGGRSDFFETDIVSVRKKAYTNACNRALKQLLGLGGFTWADIKGTVDQADVSAVAFKGKASGKAQAAPQKAAGRPRDSEPMPEGQALNDAMWKMAMDLAGGDMREAERVLSETGSFENKEGKRITGPSRPERYIPGKHDKWKAATYGKLRDAWKKNCASPETGPARNEEEAN